MTLPSVSDVEHALLPYRQIRRHVVDTLVTMVSVSTAINNPFMVLSRLFCRVKSADSILEKAKRKNIPLRDVSALPDLMTDVLGARVIVETLAELNAIDQAVTRHFDLVGRCEIRHELRAPGIEYQLRVRENGARTIFELQLRTALQHYWSMRSFHFLHKQPPEATSVYREPLAALEEALRHADIVAEDIPARTIREPLPSQVIQAIEALQTRVHLLVVTGDEQVVAHETERVADDDETSHARIVGRKLALYAQYPGAAIVECSCLNVTSYALNEPHVRFPLNDLDRL